MKKTAAAGLAILSISVSLAWGQVFERKSATPYPVVRPINCFKLSKTGETGSQKLDATGALVYSNVSNSTSYSCSFGVGSEVGDDLAMTEGGTLDTFYFSVVNPSNSAGPLTTGDLTLRFYNWNGSDYVGAGALGSIGETFNLATGEGSVFVTENLASSNIVLTADILATLEITNARGGATQIGQLLYDPPTVGTSQDMFYMDGSWYWFGGDPKANLYSRIGVLVASPTPTPVSPTPTALSPTPTSAPPTPTSAPPTPIRTATPSRTPTPSPTPTCGPSVVPQRAVIQSGDYNGDGSSDIAIFRPSAGLWSIRNITRLNFGNSSDQPAPGDYDGDGTSEISIFRASAGLWSISGFTRAYFGGAEDRSVPADYDGDGSCDIGIFRENGGMWSIRSFTRFYFGETNDWPIPGDYANDGTAEAGIYRVSSGQWMIRDITRFYFGGATDWPVPGTYFGTEVRAFGIFKACSGMWAFRDVTRIYFGNCFDYPRPGDFNGDGTDDFGIFRDATGQWAVRDLTRVYFGGSGDIPVTR
jgi:hypothetical protein